VNHTLPKHLAPGASPLVINHDAKVELTKQELERSANGHDTADVFVKLNEWLHAVRYRAKQEQSGPCVTQQETKHSALSR
jgi:hypothetical protein